MQNLISVIIPVYNVEKYLARCLDSIINQTYKNLEIICVNDCSPDNSAQILDKYAINDPRIKIINHKQNRGLSSARNSGLKVAAGKYVSFIDSDDWIDLDYLEKLHIAIIKSNQKAVCCANVLKAYDDGTTKPFSKRDFDEAVVPYFKSSQMVPTWLLKKSFLKRFDIIFPEGLKYEDLYFFHVVIRSLKQVFVINTATYYYYENKDSIMGKAQNRIIKDFDIIENLKLIYDYYKNNNKLNEWSIPFFYMPKYMLNIHQNKPEFYSRLRNFLTTVQADILNNLTLYSQLEIDFFNQVLQHEHYEQYATLDTSIIGALRNKIKKGA